MAPQYKLHYFSVTAVGEPLRFLLAYGKFDWEDIRYQMGGADWLQVKPKIGQWYYDPIPESKKAQEQYLFKEHIPFFMGKFEKIVKENSGYFVNGKLTWADIYFAAPFKYYSALVGFDLLAGYPALQALVKRVQSLPEIAKYIAQRPAGDR